MKITFRNLGILAFFTLAMFAFTACQSSNDSKEESAKPDTEQEMVHATYFCPMHCEGDKTYDHPGSCPVCGMDLEKMEDDGHGHDGHEH